MGCWESKFNDVMMRIPNEILRFNKPHLPRAFHKVRRGE